MKFVQEELVCMNHNEKIQDAGTGQCLNGHCQLLFLWDSFSMFYSSCLGCKHCMVLGVGVVHKNRSVVTSICCVNDAAPCSEQVHSRKFVNDI